MELTRHFALDWVAPHEQRKVYRAAHPSASRSEEKKRAFSVFAFALFSTAFVRHQRSGSGQAGLGCFDCQIDLSSTTAAHMAAAVCVWYQPMLSRWLLFFFYRNPLRMQKAKKTRKLVSTGYQQLFNTLLCASIQPTAIDMEVNAGVNWCERAEGNWAKAKVSSS